MAVAYGFNAEGGSYEGEYVGGKPHGKGKLILPDGRVIEGVFKDGKFFK